ncbi:MAG: hypothetical protein OHK0024_13260 [Thalassobaculales bacterium]
MRRGTAGAAASPFVPRQARDEGAQGEAEWEGGGSFSQEHRSPSRLLAGAQNSARSITMGSFLASASQVCMSGVAQMTWQ